MGQWWHMRLKALLCTEKELEAKGLVFGRDQGAQECYVGGFCPGQPPPPPRQHFCCRWHLSLPSAGAILGCRTYQLSRPGLRAPPPAGKPGVWEAGAGPGKTGHQSCLAIPSGPGEERASESQQMAKYRNTQRWKWFLLASGGHPVPSPRSSDEALGTVLVRLSSGCRAQPGAGSGRLEDLSLDLVSDLHPWLGPWHGLYPTLFLSSDLLYWAPALG